LVYLLKEWQGIVRAMDDEILDLVNERDEVIGQIARGDFQKVFDNPPGNIRTSCAFIRNSRGQLWIPRRTADKKIAPNGLDYSVAEHIPTGESYDEAIIRGFQEELNIEIDPAKLRLLEVITPEATFPIFRALYAYESDDTPENYNRADFTEYMWVTPQEAIAQIEKGELAKRDLLSGLRLFASRIDGDQ